MELASPFQARLSEQDGACFRGGMKRVFSDWQQAALAFEVRKSGRFLFARSPSALFSPFWLGGFPTKIEYRKNNGCWGTFYIFAYCGLVAEIQPLNC